VILRRAAAPADPSDAHTELSFSDGSSGGATFRLPLQPLQLPYRLIPLGPLPAHRDVCAATDACFAQIALVSRRRGNESNRPFGDVGEAERKLPCRAQLSVRFSTLTRRRTSHPSASRRSDAGTCG
jgi:hypothetical protein